MLARLAFAVLTCGLAATVAAAGPRPTLPVTLVWVDPGAHAAFAAEAAMEEATALLRTAGAEVRWLRTSAPTILNPGDLAVIVVPSVRANPRMVLGSAQIEGEVPAVWIHPEAVSAAVGLGDLAPREWTGPERSNFARALGRVAAHEVVHALLGSARHASIGLMARTLVRRDLLSPVLAVDRDTRRAIDRVFADPYRWSSR
jgi:hypothetical protein